MEENAHRRDMATSSSLVDMKSSDLIIKTPLDYGGFGEVFLCYHKTLGRVVLKRVYTGPPRHEQKLSLLEEGSLMSRLNHDRVVKLLGVILEDGDYSLVMEFIPKGNLLVMLQAVAVPMSVKARVIVEILEGMVYLTNNRVIHKDLKPENILVDEDFHIKIADLGLATCKTWSRLTKDESRRKSRGAQSYVGTPGTLYYIAPEHLENINTPSTEKSDVYSFAIVVWVILTSQEPYENAVNPSQVQFCVCQGNRPDETLIPTDAPKEIIQLMKACWNQEPQSRPTFKESYDSFLHFYKKELEKDIKEDLQTLMTSYKGPSDLVSKMSSLTTEESSRLELQAHSYMSMSSVDSPTTLRSSNMEPVEASLEDLGLHSNDFQDDARVVGQANFISHNHPSHLEQKLHQELNYHKHGSYNPEHLILQPSSSPSLPSPGMPSQSSGGDVPHQVSSVQSWSNPTPELSPAEEQHLHPTASSPKDGLYRPEYGSHISMQSSVYQPYVQPQYNRTQSWPEAMPDYRTGVATPLTGVPAETGSLYISHARGIQIGSNNTMTLGSIDSSISSQSSVTSSSSRYKELLQKYEDHTITDNHLEVARQNLGKNWKSCARKLGLTDVEIDNIEHDYSRDGLAEKVHQMLERWKMKEGLQGCTVGKLFSGLDRNVKSEVLYTLLLKTQECSIANNGNAGDNFCP